MFQVVELLLILLLDISSGIEIGPRSRNTSDTTPASSGNRFAGIFAGRKTDTVTPSQQSSAERSAAGRIKVRLGAILPEQLGAKRIYTNFLDKELREFNGHKRKQPPPFQLLKYSFTDHFFLEHATVFLRSPSSPLDIIKALCEQMIAQNVAAIIYITPWEVYGESTASSQYLIHLASFTGIPLIAWNADNSGLILKRNDFSKETYRLLQIAPNLRLQVAAMMAVLYYYKWNLYTIVTGDIAGHKNFIQECQSFKHPKDFQPEIIDVVTLNFHNYTEVLEKLNRVNASEARIFLLYSTKNEADHLFNIARRIGITGKNYLWIVTQSIIGSNVGREKAAKAFYPSGMFGIHFNTENHPTDTKHNAVYDQIANSIRITCWQLPKVIRLGCIFLQPSQYVLVDYSNLSRC